MKFLLLSFFPFTFFGFRNYKGLISLAFISSLALEDVDLNKVYILGGLVDESIQKVSVHFVAEKLYSEKWFLLLEAPSL